MKEIYKIWFICMYGVQCYAMLPRPIVNQKYQQFQKKLDTDSEFAIQHYEFVVDHNQQQKNNGMQGMQDNADFQIGKAYAKKMLQVHKKMLKVRKNQQISDELGLEQFDSSSKQMNASLRKQFEHQNAQHEETYKRLINLIVPQLSWSEYFFGLFDSTQERQKLLAAFEIISEEKQIAQARNELLLKKNQELTQKEKQLMVSSIHSMIYDQIMKSRLEKALLNLQEQEYELKSKITEYNNFATKTYQNIQKKQATLESRLRKLQAKERELKDWQDGLIIWSQGLKVQEENLRDLYSELSKSRLDG